MKKLNVWTVIKWLLIALALVFLLIVLVGAGDEPEPMSAKERMAQFAAQEEYYRVLNLYGDKIGAEQSARLTYEQMMED